MSRNNFYDLLENKEISIPVEFLRIYSLFYRERNIRVFSDIYSINGFIEHYYRKLKPELIKRTTTLNDFNQSYGFNFQYYKEEDVRRLNIDDFILFSEYIYNLTLAAIDVYFDISEKEIHCCGIEQMITVTNNILSYIEDLGYMPVNLKDILIFVKKAPQTIAVSKIVEEKLSLKICEYNHFKMQGNLMGKLFILKLMADDIEPQLKTLKSINSGLESHLSQMLNKFVRHNNTDNEYIKSLTDKEIEQWYDDIYQMWLLAKLEIENVERTKKVRKVLGMINK